MLPLPTDNLYKFMALAGLLVLGFSLYYPSNQLNELRKEQVQLEGEIRLLEMQSASESPESPPSMELKTKIEQLATKMELHNVALKQVTTFIYLRAIGIFVGILMTVFGFVLWYVKVQRYQDLILSRDATPVKPETVENPPPSQDKPDGVQH